MQERVNPLPDDKILALSRFERICRQPVNCYSILSFYKVENIVGKEENVGCQHFLLFPKCSQKAFASWASKVVFVW